MRKIYKGSRILNYCFVKAKNVWLWYVYFECLDVTLISMRTFPFLEIPQKISFHSFFVLFINIKLFSGNRIYLKIFHRFSIYNYIIINNNLQIFLKLRGQNYISGLELHDISQIVNRNLFLKFFKKIAFFMAHIFFCKKTKAYAWP